MLPTPAGSDICWNLVPFTRLTSTARPKAWKLRLECGGPVSFPDDT